MNKQEWNLNKKQNIFFKKTHLNIIHKMLATLVRLKYMYIKWVLWRYYRTFICILYKIHMDIHNLTDFLNLKLCSVDFFQPIILPNCFIKN